MPGGLRDVSQNFSADASKYIEEVQKIIRANREVMDSIREVQRARAEADTAGAGGAAAFVREYNRAMDEHNRAMAEAIKVNKEFNAAQQETARLSADGKRALNNLAEAHDLAWAASARHTQAQEDLARAHVAEMSHLDQMVVKLGAAKDAYASLGDASAPLAYTTKHVQALNDALDVAERRANSFATAFYGAGGASRGGDAGRFIGAGAFGPIPPGGATFGGDGGGGAGGPGWFAKWMQGGGGGGGGGAGGFVPWAGGGWQAVRFWGMMGAEIASTVVPAIVAAGSAAAVGAQGFEQLQNRMQAVYTVGEALGGAYGTTAGQFLGGGNALQQAQNAAQGGVWELLGGLTRISKSGAGGGFLNLGTQTLAMVDRGWANLVTGVTQGQTGQKLLSAVSGGTGYLQQFGDIGANLGTALLNFAPNLPGVGTDLLGTLTGASGLLRSASGLPAPLLKGFFTYEAASRWLPAILGGKGLIGRMLGLRGIGGVGGLLSKIGMGDLGTALAGLSGPEIGLPVALASGVYSGLDTIANTPIHQMIAQQQVQVSQGGFSDALPALGHALSAVTAAQASYAGLPYAPPTRRQLASREGAGIQAAYAMSNQGALAKASQDFAQQIGELVNSGPQLQQALTKLGMKGVSLADAFQIAQDALITIPHAFGPGGKINKTALSQLASYVQAFGPMTQSPGAFGSVVAGYGIMSSGQMKNLSAANQAMDSYAQIMSGGPLAMAGMAATARGLDAGKMAKALTSFTSPAGSAAWQAFIGTAQQPGPVTQMQNFNDQMRSYLALGALTQGQAAGLTGFELKQFLPMARRDPAALAMLMQQGAQQGVTGYYDPSKSLAQNYQAAAEAAKKFGDSSKQAQKDMTSAVIASSNIPATAKALLGTAGADIQAQRAGQLSQDAMNIQKASLKGAIDKGSVSDLVTQLKSIGVQGGAALKTSLDSVLRQAGVSGAMRVKIETQVQPPKLPPLPKGAGTVTYNSKVHPPAAPPPPKGGLVNYPSHVQTPVAPPAPRGGTVVYTSVVLPPAGGGVGMATATGTSARFIGHQTGGLVPGTGRGDIVPSMLEPGEAIVPRSLVPLVAPILAAHGVPGFGGTPMSSGTHFAAGGVVPNAPLPIPAAAQKIIDAFERGLPHNVWGRLATEILQGLLDGIRNAHAETAKMAQTLVNKVSSEVNYAKNVASSTVQGLNLAGMQVAAPGSQINMHPAAPGTKGYNAAQWNAYIQAYASDSLPGGVNAPAQPQTVQQQMQSYLKSITAFRHDLGALTKGHLNKDLLKQLIAAGPVQGDALAQSIMGGQGGIGAVNKLWAQINQQAKALGMTAAHDVYGPVQHGKQVKVGVHADAGPVHALQAAINQLHGKTVVIQVQIEQGGGAGGIKLSKAELSSITHQVQKSMLQQAKRNRRTGLQLQGYGA